MSETRKAGGIEYSFTPKNVKNVNIRVHPDGTVRVSAPRGMSGERVDEIVLSKADFILKARERKSPEKDDKDSTQYVTGERFRFLGKELTLQIKSGAYSATVENGILTVTLENTHNYALRKKAVNDFFTLQREKIFGALIERYYCEFARYGIARPALKIKKMRSRWGSCTPSKGLVTLAEMLIEQPMECIEYVVVHEYCHFLELNHSPRFYAHVAAHMPDWKERRDKLNRPR